MTPSDHELPPAVTLPEPGTPATEPSITDLGPGAVFVRKSAILPDPLSQSGQKSVLGWLWFFQTPESDFKTAVKNAGWTWFFMGEVITVKTFGEWNRETALKLLEKALLSIHQHNPNTFTVVAITPGRSLGFKSVSLSVQARHLQRGLPGR